METTTHNSASEPPEFSAQFPYGHSTDPLIRARVADAIGTVLADNDNMIYQLVRRMAGGKLDDAAVQDIAQRCRCWLWQKSLPRYDAHHKYQAKTTTFLYKCIFNFVRQEIRAIKNKKNKSISVDNGTLDNFCAPDNNVDREIEAFAGRILRSPEKYLTTSQVEVFRAVTNRTMPLQDVAKKLKYARPGSMSEMMRRIRERILELYRDQSVFAGGEGG